MTPLEGDLPKVSCSPLINTTKLPPSAGPPNYLKRGARERKARGQTRVLLSFQISRKPACLPFGYTGEEFQGRPTPRRAALLPLIAKAAVIESSLSNLQLPPPQLIKM